MSADNPPEQPSTSIQKMPPASPGASSSPSQPEIFQQFLQNQAQEIAIRGQELTLRQKEIETSHEYANRALDAQVEDRKDERRYKKGASRDRLILSGIGLTLLAGFVLYALYLGKDQVAMEALKDLVILLAGGLGGYGIRVVKEREQKDSDGE